MKWMTSRFAILRFIMISAPLVLAVQFAGADPSKYPQFAQQKLPDNVSPQFVSVDEVFADLKAGRKPMIIDVRSEEEFREVHIPGAVSAPLGEFGFHLK